jgi:hypothetical protein
LPLSGLLGASCWRPAPLRTLIAQPLLDAFSKLTDDDRLVLSGTALVLVPDLAQVGCVGERVVFRAPAKIVCHPVPCHSLMMTAHRVH